MRPGWMFPWGALPLLLAGCSLFGGSTAFDPEELDATAGWLAVRSVAPVLQQEQTDCGAAALSMVLTYWDSPLSMEELARSCPAIPERGIKAKDLRDFARGQGLASYLIHGCFSDLERELGQGHPLIVGLVKPDGAGAVTHYEVVVAVHPEQKTVVTLDPARGWRQNSQSGFLKEWEPAGFLTLVFFPSGDAPAPANAEH